MKSLRTIHISIVVLTVYQALWGQPVPLPQQQLIDNHNVAVVTSVTNTYQLIIPLTIKDKINVIGTRLFGVHSQATDCVDTLLGEFELPPLPPAGYFDARFSNVHASCMGQQTYIDLHSYSSPTQVDSYLILFQPGLGGSPITFSWPRLDSLYSGSVRLIDLRGDSLVNVDMKSETSYVVSNYNLNSLLIIAEGPIGTQQLLPYGYTWVYQRVTNFVDFFGTVNPNGSYSSTWFEYGTTTSHENMTSIHSVEAHANYAAVSEEILGLRPNAVYHFRQAVKNVYGTFYSPDLIFSSSPAGRIPLATTGAATNVTTTAALLNATVESDSGPAEVDFEWGISNMYGNKALAGVTDTKYPKTISFNLTSLLPNTSYHYRVIATNSSGRSIGADHEFTTLLSSTGQPPSVGMRPSVTTGFSTNIFTISAMLNAVMQSSENPTTLYFQWGTSTLYDNSTPPVDTVDTGLVSLSYGLTYLSPNTTYHYRAVASNSNGTTYGEDHAFTTLTADISERFRIPIMVHDDSAGFGMVTFGVHPRATDCIDTTLGELELLPIPSIGNFDVRLIHPDSFACASLGVTMDLRPYHDSSQTDEYIVHFQTGVNGKHITLSWPRLRQTYYGAVTMFPFNGIPQIDMKSVNTVTFDSTVHTVKIIAQGPVIGIPLPFDSSIAPRIVSIRDLPNDEGGRVTLRWEASALDTDAHTITTYSIWRGAPASTSLHYLDVPLANQSTPPRSLVMNVSKINDVEIKWKWIANVLTNRSSIHTCTAATLCDSGDATDGKQYFMVSAQTNEPIFFYDSNIDSGYSVDNVPPKAPIHFAAKKFENAVLLQWDANKEPDIRKYIIYRSTAHIGNPDTAAPLTSTPDTTFLDNIFFTNDVLYYLVRAQDIHGNLSSPGQELFVERRGLIQRNMDVPFSHKFYQNYPNPFNPTTTIAFDIARPGFVTITLYNTLGEEVASLVKHHLDAGEYVVPWNGSGYFSGVYFCRLVIADETSGTALFTRTVKLLLIK